MHRFFYPIFCGLILLSSGRLLYAAPKCSDVQVENGRCVDVGAYQLFMNVQGETGPTVVFEAGRGDTTVTWNKVIPEVAQFARAVSYDRVNLGFSQSLPNATTPVTAEQIALNLHTLLHNAKLAPPYILVGHSNGGLYAQMFARLYPKEVAGVVFVDSASANQNLSDKLPPLTDPAYGESLGFKASQQQVKAAPPFPAVPIIVLTASYHGSTDPDAVFHTVDEKGQAVTLTEAQAQRLWEGWQNQLAKLSPNSAHIYAFGSDHYIQNIQPSLVVDAVYTVIKMQKRAHLGSIYAVPKDSSQII